ncbi:glucose-6-phosphate isomerase [Lysobacter oculi]|uniref:Glucose-6-phosphate isomerase n=1 Tax=Solilutibacter oculi TaxID=2698682 RepID=A0A344J463_9GAMM|nr:glucose-6-phosphate isomerase [Lysobacter oculi]AXA83823.1 glucose-6-phosphate isomerase [Lysobacter oculi]
MQKRLAEQAARLGQGSLWELVTGDPARATDFALRVGPLYANFARQHVDREALAVLFDIAREADLPAAMRRLVDGEPVNFTENRAALHTALRGDLSPARAARDAHRQAGEALARMEALVARLHADSRITDVVSVGIGGSDLGPRLVVDALSRPDAPVCVHFVSNVDASAIERTLVGLDPARTAGIVISKSFGTQETLLNGAILRDWLGDGTRLFAVSANVERAGREFGIAPERMLPMWDWVGGRYSLWSAVGFPIALALGMPAFRELLAGAAAFDRHAVESPLEDNLAVWHALTAVWNRNALGAAAQAVFPYDERLRLLPAYLQQLVMESLGKQARHDGEDAGIDTVPVWWGGVGSDVQHSFFQALHQGTQQVPADFIGVSRSDHGHEGSHAAMLSNLLAQTEALANGQPSTDPHRRYPGGRPSTLLLLDALTPSALGHLLALYEHSTYLQAVLWGINAFDQFGVELGKQMATKLLPALRGEAEADDPVTRELLSQIRAPR